MSSTQRSAGVRTSDLEARVRSLETTNRILVVAVALVIVGAASGFGLPGAVERAADSGAQVIDQIQARRIQLVDAEGRVRIDLRHDNEETGLFIMDDAGDTRLGAAQFAHGGGGYALHGPGGRGAAVLYLRGDGSLTMYDADGNVTARFAGEGR